MLLKIFIIIIAASSITAGDITPEMRWEIDLLKIDIIRPKYFEPEIGKNIKIINQWCAYVFMQEKYFRSN